MIRFAGFLFVFYISFVSIFISFVSIFLSSFLLVSFGESFGESLGETRPSGIVVIITYEILGRDAQPARGLRVVETGSIGIASVTGVTSVAGVASVAGISGISRFVISNGPIEGGHTKMRSLILPLLKIFAFVNRHGIDAGDLWAEHIFASDGDNVLSRLNSGPKRLDRGFLRATSTTGSRLRQWRGPVHDNGSSILGIHCCILGILCSTCGRPALC